MEWGEKSEALMLDAGQSLRVQGPGKDEGPLPAFIYFFTSAEQSLDQAPVNGVISELKGTPLRCFSWNLPDHGPDQDPIRGIARWAGDYARGQDPLDTFLAQSLDLIRSLIAEKWIDEKALFLGGLSRGAFVATHLAAQLETVRGILGFAPLSRLDTTKEFASFASLPAVYEKNLSFRIPQLIGKPLRYYIGNRDERVSTQACFDFVQELTEASFQAKHRSPQVELIICPSIGHKGHGTGQDTFSRGALWLKNQLKITSSFL